MKSTKRSAALIFSVVFICLVLFANCLIVAGYDHDCVGENCIVCYVINTAKKILGGFTLLALSSMLFAVLLKHKLYNALNYYKQFFSFSLFSLKVKLSD